MKPLASVAVTVIGKLPVLVGVPISVAPEKVIPAGKEPLSLNVTGDVPPDSVKVVGG